MQIRSILYYIKVQGFKYVSKPQLFESKSYVLWILFESLG